jgi:hypothetical protein
MKCFALINVPNHIIRLVKTCIRKVKWLLDLRTVLQHDKDSDLWAAASARTDGPSETERRSPELYKYIYTQVLPLHTPHGKHILISSTSTSCCVITIYMFLPSTQQIYQIVRAHFCVNCAFIWVKIYLSYMFRLPWRHLQVIHSSDSEVLRCNLYMDPYNLTIIWWFFNVLCMHSIAVIFLYVRIY